MAKGKKSSLDIDEPVVVQDAAEETAAVIPAVEEKTVEPVKEENKAEVPKETVEKKRRSVLICVM